MQLERHPDPKRINGLVLEDRLRTTAMFLAGNLPWHPNAPVDIEASADLIQKLPTHIKAEKTMRSKRDGRALAISVDMACAYQLFQLKGSQRLLIGLYDVEEWLDADGNKFTVNRYHTILEIILTEKSLAALRGDISVDEIGRIRDLILLWDHTKESVEDARLRFHPMLRALEKRRGLAHPTAKLSINRRTGKPDNKRIQTALAVAPLRDLVTSEDQGDLQGIYRGIIDQPRFIEHTEEFHGLKLPWRTTENWPRLKKIKPSLPSAPKLEPTPIEVQGPFQQYIDRWIDSTFLRIPGGRITIMHHDNGMRTIATESDDDEVRKHVSRVCRFFDGEWIKEGRCWLVTADNADRVQEALKPRSSLPSAQISILKPVNAGKGVHEFPTASGSIRAIRMSTNWVLRPRPRNEREARDIPLRIAVVCRAYGVGQYYVKDDKRNWIIPHHPPELIQDLALAIQQLGLTLPPTQ